MSTTTKRKKPAEKAKPVLHVQVGGIRIPIWKNEGDEGKVFYKAGTPELSYKGTDDQWHTATSYSARDLVNLIKAAALAHSEISKRNFAERTVTDEDLDETE